MVKNIEQRRKLIDALAIEYKKGFAGLSSKEKKLLVYRTIIELKEQGIKSDDELEETDTLKALVEATDKDVSLFGATILYIMLDNDKQYQELYSKSLVSYNKILASYRGLASELNVDNPLDLAHMFTYMLWNGYYSVNKKHCYKLQERMLLPGMHSFDVIKGKGVCLAYAELLHNYLDACNEKSALLACKFPTKKAQVSCDYKPTIERDREISLVSNALSHITSVIFRGLINKIGNHVVTLMEDNGNLFVYDPTNLLVLNVIDDTRAEVINGKGEFQLKPFSTLVIQPTADPDNLFEQMLSVNIKPALTRKEVIFSFENMMELLNDNKALLDDAYDDIHSELELIDKQTNEIGNHRQALRRIRKNNRLNG